MTYKTGAGWNLDIVTAYGLTIEGIRKALMLCYLNIPVVENADDFKKFLKEVKIGQNAIAIIDDVLFHEHEGKHVFAIYYEKGLKHDVLICFDSMNQRIDISNSKILEYFKEPLLIMTPDRRRQSNQETTCHAYAIEDAIILSQSLQKMGCLPISIPRISSFKACQRKSDRSIFSLFYRNLTPSYYEHRVYELTEEFLNFDATQIKKELFEMLIQDEFNESEDHFESVLR